MEWETLELDGLKYVAPYGKYTLVVYERYPLGNDWFVTIGNVVIAGAINQQISVKEAKAQAGAAAVKDGS